MYGQKSFFKTLSRLRFGLVGCALRIFWGQVIHAKNVAFTYETIRLDYTLEGTYVPDFILPSGIMVEAKGHLRTEDRRKLRAVKTQHPHLDIRLCFQNANEKISKKWKAYRVTMK